MRKTNENVKNARQHQLKDYNNKSSRILLRIFFLVHAKIFQNLKLLYSKSQYFLKKYILHQKFESYKTEPNFYL